MYYKCSQRTYGPGTVLVPNNVLFSRAKCLGLVSVFLNLMTSELKSLCTLIHVPSPTVNVILLDFVGLLFIYLMCSLM